MPIDRGAIDAQLRDIGEGERWWEQREFRDLPHILHPEEQIRGIVDGNVLGRRRPRLLATRGWLIVATSQRLICLKKERAGRREVDVPWDYVAGLEHRSRLRGVQITLYTARQTYRIRVQKEDAFRFIGAITPLVPQRAAGAPVLAVPAATGLSGLLSRVTALPGPEYATAEDLARVEAAVERLENQVERLQSHVEFLENLLEKRAEGAFSLPGRSADA